MRIPGFGFRTKYRGVLVILKCLLCYTGCFLHVYAQDFSASSYKSRADSLIALKENQKAIQLVEDGIKRASENREWADYLQLQVSKSQIYDLSKEHAKRLQCMDEALKVAHRELVAGDSLFGDLFRQKGEALTALGQWDSSSFYLMSARKVFAAHQKMGR